MSFSRVSVVILSAIFTYKFILPLAVLDMDLTNSKVLLQVLFVMLLFTSLFTKLLNTILRD